MYHVKYIIEDICPCEFYFDTEDREKKKRLHDMAVKPSDNYD